MERKGQLTVAIIARMILQERLAQKHADLEESGQLIGAGEDVFNFLGGLLGGFVRGYAHCFVNCFYGILNDGIVFSLQRTIPILGCS